MKKSKVSTVSATSVGGVPVVIPNKVVFETSEKVEYNGNTYDGFYISHNSHDTGVYGGETTAIVLGQMQMFFILNGDHEGELKEAPSKGFLFIPLYAPFRASKTQLPRRAQPLHRKWSNQTYQSRKSSLWAFQPLPSPFAYLLLSAPCHFP